MSTIAYFSMEIGLEYEMHTYSGGLGVLAGDTMRSAADLRIPMVGVTLLHRKGYFQQVIDTEGHQHERPSPWFIDHFLNELPRKSYVVIEGRKVHLRAWVFNVKGVTGHVVPVYFLDADLPENSDEDKGLTDFLYGGDERYRLCQEIILGIGGVRMLRAQGYDDIERFHMNEGHAAFLTLELLDENARKLNRNRISYEDVEAVRGLCVFTTHTPVPAGHDQFPLHLVRSVIGPREDFFDLRDIVIFQDRLNMTYLALNLSHYVNGVAKRHKEVSGRIFEGYDIDSITNGVHAATWVSPHFQRLYDQHIPGWREDNFSLRYALSIPEPEIIETHRKAKHDIILYTNDITNTGLSENVFTIGFARRATAYKRADLLFYNTERLVDISTRLGPIQVIYGGKAHPRDNDGKELIRRVSEMGRQLKYVIKVIYLENYDMKLGRIMTAGVDLWLNTPEPPMEASGTSGMKAALNGVPSLSILDGWWVEGALEGITGWSIRNDSGEYGQKRDSQKDAEYLYEKLEKIILPLFYKNYPGFVHVMRNAIAINGSFFNTQRMLQEYVLKAYF